MPANSFLSYEEVLLLEKLRKNNKAGFKRIFECYYPRVYFFVSRLLKQDVVSNRVALDCFIQLADMRSRLTCLNGAIAFLYSCAQAACLEFRSQNTFFDNRRVLMGYNLREKKRNTFLDILFAEASFAIYLGLCEDLPASERLPGMNAGPLNGLPALEMDAGIAPEIMPEAEMNDGSGIAMAEIMRMSVLLKDLILSVVYHKKDSALSPGRLDELNNWLMPDIERRILLDELKDPVNRSNAMLFFRNIDSRKAFETIKRRIVFAGPFSFIGAARLFG